MQIILMRHGKPDLYLEVLKRRKVSPTEVGEIVRDYEGSALSPDTTPPEDSRAMALECGAAISSDLLRATQSIKRLGVQDSASVDPEFTESAMPYLRWQWPKLAFYTYCIIFRVFWFAGFSSNGEAYRTAKIRSARCAAKLEHCAADKGSVLFLGHGIMNRLISRDLKRLGWSVKRKGGDDYWSYSVFHK